MKDKEQININFHSESKFETVVKHGLVHGGVHCVAGKGHGKTRLLFGMAKKLRNLADCRALIFDGSEAWLYGFDRIPTFTITERDVTLAKEIETIEQIERYELKNWELIKLALATEKDLLFRIKSRKPSKRGFVVRSIVNYLDSLQRAERAKTQDNEATRYIAYFIEEAQDCFNSRSTTRLEAEEFLTVFNEGRNQKEAFFTASQRLTDFSKTIRTKQSYVIGRINEEDKTAFLRRLENKHNVNFSELKQRHWFFNGVTFKSPEWKQSGKPYQIQKEIKKKYVDSLKPKAEQKPKGKLRQFFETLDTMLSGNSHIEETLEETLNKDLSSDLDDTLDEDLLLWEEFED
jgi:hypothetical protein